MANNRMWLVHDASGQKVHIASHFAGAWKVWIAETLVERLNAAFAAECNGFGGTGWHVEYEHHSLRDEPLAPSTTETYQTTDGTWHVTPRPETPE